MDGVICTVPATDGSEAAPERAADIAIGQRIRLLREHRRLTQAQLARAIGVSYQQVYKYERGIDRLSVGRLVLIATALAVSPHDLLDGLSGPEEGTGAARLPVIERIRLLEAYADIPDADVRGRVQGLVRSLADAAWVQPATTRSAA